jgi:hypothetical protein
MYFVSGALSWLPKIMEALTNYVSEVALHYQLSPPLVGMTQKGNKKKESKKKEKKKLTIMGKIEKVD